MTSYHRTMTSPLVVTVIAVVTSLVGGCSEPSDWRPQTDVERLIDARVALYATVVKTYPDHRFDYGAGTTAYTALVDVHCILKGQQTERLVNITEAGR